MEVPRLHPETIEEVKQKVDIVEVIGEVVLLKKKGKDYQGLCPFHQEKSPSFTVSPAKQMYYCFGCGAGGNVYKFLMELGKASFQEVVFDLARRYQVPIKTLEPEQRKELQRQLSLREQLYEILAVAAHFYHHTLYQPQGEKALEYLMVKRNLQEVTIQQFQLGYAPAGWETLYRYLIEQKHYPLTLVEQAGLIKARQSGSGHYDQFRDRLMIPIADAQGRVIAFGSRSLGSEEPKYLNSPETELFNKGKTLFGLDQAKKAIQQQDQALVVEGYFDVIALHHYGFNHAVAALGTALSQDQIKLLLRYTESKQIIFNFDADKAGIKATQRAIQEIEPLVYSGQVNLKILNLPAGKDADEFLSSQLETSQAYQQLLTTAPSWFEWQVQQLLAQNSLKQAEQFDRVSQGMVQLLRQFQDPNKQAYYLQYCAEILCQGDVRLIPLQTGLLSQQIRQPQGRSTQKRSPRRVKNPDSSLLAEAESLLLLIYLHCPDFRTTIKQELEDKDLLFSFAHHRLLWQTLLWLEGQGPTDLAQGDSLVSRLADAYLNLGQDTRPIEALLHLTEKTQADIFRPELRIPEAIAALERVTWQKYYDYCSQRFQQMPAQAGHYYYQEMLKAKQKIHSFDQQRCQASP
jgi:DNA primase